MAKKTKNEMQTDDLRALKTARQKAELERYRAEGKTGMHASVFRNFPFDRCVLFDPLTGTTMKRPAKK